MILTPIEIMFTVFSQIVYSSIAKKINAEKYAIAAVFHDIGIWTNHTLDYLDPSAGQAKAYLTETGSRNGLRKSP